MYICIYKQSHKNCNPKQSTNAKKLPTTKQKIKQFLHDVLTMWKITKVKFRTIITNTKTKATFLHTPAPSSNCQWFMPWLKSETRKTKSGLEDNHEILSLARAGHKLSFLQHPASMVSVRMKVSNWLGIKYSKQENQHVFIYVKVYEKVVYVMYVFFAKGRYLSAMNNSLGMTIKMWMLVVELLAWIF